MTITNAPLHEDPTVHGRRWFLLGVMCLSLVLVVMSVSGLNVALPSLQRDLGATQTGLQWIVDAYALVFAGLLLTAGAMGDRFGRKKALLAGLGVFAVGAAVAGLGGATSQVIAGRAIMGVGAAAIMPATLSIINAIFPPAERGRAIAIWAGFAGAGGGLGVLVSGALLEAFWWGAALLFNVPAVVVVAAFVIAFAPATRDPGETPLDLLGAVLSLAGISTLVYAIIEGPVRGWTDPLVVAGFAAAAVLLVAFVGYERRREHPMLPMSLFADRRFSVGSGAITVVFAVMFAFFFLTVQYFQFVKGYSALEAGLAFLPVSLVLIAVAPRSEALAERFGPRAVVATGFALIAAGYLGISSLGPDSSYWLFLAYIVPLGFGMGTIMPPSTAAIMAAVPEAKGGIGSAVNDTSRELGGALGIAVFGSIATDAYARTLDTSALPGPAADAAEESVSAALAIAEQIGGAQGAQLANEVGQAFTDAFGVAGVASAGLALAAAVVVAVVAPAHVRSREQRPRAEQAEPR